MELHCGVFLKPNLFHIVTNLLFHGGIIWEWEGLGRTQGLFHLHCKPPTTNFPLKSVYYFLMPFKILLRLINTLNQELPMTQLQHGVNTRHRRGKRSHSGGALGSARQSPKHFICCCRSERLERRVQQSLVRGSLGSDSAVPRPLHLTLLLLLCSLKNPDRSLYSPVQWPDPRLQPAAPSHECTMQRGRRRALQSCYGTLSLSDTPASQ